MTWNDPQAKSGSPWRTALGGALLLFSTAAAAAPAPAGEPAPELFRSVLETLRAEARIPGLSVAVVRDRRVVFAEGLGRAVADEPGPATADTPYDIASVTKPISAVVALALVEDGVLDLDRPLAGYSDWREFCEELSRQPSIFARDLRCDPAVHTLRHLLSHTAAGRPGERFSYNPILYSWASRPLMALTGTSFSSLVARHVFEPAGMSSSARRHRDLPLPASLARELAPPHRIDAAGLVVPSPALDPQGDGAAGGVISTVRDLARFDAALDGGALIAPASRDAMMRPVRSTGGAELPYGLGWFVQEHEGRELVWHSGWWEEAYSALYLKVPDEGLTCILLANSEGLWWDNPLDAAEVQRSPFARACLETWLGPAPGSGR